MPLPNINQTDATLAIAAEGAAMAVEMDKAEDELRKIDDTLTSMFVAIDDMLKLDRKMVASLEGMFEIEADRWSQENLGRGQELEALRESAQEDLVGNDKQKDSMFDKAMDKVAKEASTLGLVLAALAAGFIAFTDELPDWLKRILGIEKTAKQYDASRQQAETSVEKSLLGENEYFGPEFIGRAIDTYSSEMDFLRADEKKKNPNLSQEAIDFNAEQRRMGFVNRMDEEGNTYEVDASFLEKYITGRDDPVLQEYRDKREKIETLIEQRNDLLESYETVKTEKQTLLAAGMKRNHPEYEKLIYKQNTIIEKIEAVDNELKPLIPGAKDSLENTAPPAPAQKIQPQVEPATERNIDPYTKMVDVTSDEAWDKEEKSFTDRFGGSEEMSDIQKKVEKSSRTPNPSANPDVTKSISTNSQAAASPVVVNNVDNSTTTNVVGGGGGGKSTGRATPSASNENRGPLTNGHTILTPNGLSLF